MAGLSAATAYAWTTPVGLSDNGSGSEPSVPRVIDAPDGTVHVVYRQKPEWRIYYRERSASGHWQPIQIISSVFSDRPDILLDADGCPHVVYAGRGVDDQFDLFQARRENGVWITNPVTQTPHSEDEPRMALDTAGRIHLVYTRTDHNSDRSGSVLHRSWNGAWSAEATLGSVADAYYHRPDICADPDGTLHAVWTANGGTRHRVKYARRSGGSWSGAEDIGGSDASGSFVAYPKIAAAAASGLVAVWHDSGESGSRICYTSTLNGGTGWSAAQTLLQGHYPSLDSGEGHAHLICERQPDGKALLYATWNASGWSAAQTVTPPSSEWKGWPDLVEDSTGAVHVVYDDVLEANWHSISYITSAADLFPPGPVTSLKAVAGNTTVHLTWTNPADQDFHRTVIRTSMHGYPAGPEAGSLVCDVHGLPASTADCDHSPVQNGRVYWYSAFAYDAVGNVSATAAHATAVPFGPADFDRDGDVDLSDFGAFQACYSGPSVPQNDPACQDQKLDGDADVDLSDFGIFQNCLSGPHVPADPDCNR
ncbi:MAG: hypothetical protein AMXMBFR13_26810 [Phycisphaerae bacterium]